MTNEFGHLASIAAVGAAAGFFIMGVHQAAPDRPATPVAAAPAAGPEQPPYEEGAARLMTQSVLGNSSSAIDPGSYRPAPEPDPDVQAVAVPVSDPPDAPMPAAVAGMGEREPRAWRVEPGRDIEGERPLVEQRVDTSVRAFVERQRIRGAPHMDRMVRPLERREERRVVASRVVSRAGAGPVIGQGARRGFGGGGSGGGHGGAPGGGRR